MKRQDFSEPAALQTQPQGDQRLNVAARAVGQQGYVHGSAWHPGIQEIFESGNRFGQVLPPKADAEVVIEIVEIRAG